MTDHEHRSHGWPAHRVTGVDVWPYRLRDGEAEFLLLHRSGRDGPPFWQGVSGWIERDEPPHVAALRELREETGFEAEALFSIDASRSSTPTGAGSRPSRPRAPPRRSSAARRWQG